MARTGRSTAEGLITLCLIVACLISGCAPSTPDTGACGTPPEAEPGDLRTLVDTTGGLVLGAAALRDGSVVVARDSHPEPAGGGDEGWTPDPGLLLLRADGSCEDFPRPVVDGRPVGAEARPVAVGPDGRLYLWDAAELRLVRGTVGGAWETVVTIPGTALMWAPDLVPAVTVTGDGEVYVLTDFAAARVTPTGGLQPVAGTGTDAAGGLSYPPPALGTFPRTGISAPLPLLTSIAAGSTGSVVITTPSAVLELDADGVLHLVADPGTTAGQSGRIEPLREEGDALGIGSRLTTLAVTGSGDVLVGDSGLQRVLRIRDATSTVLVDGPSAIAPGSPLTADDSGVLVLEGGGERLALFGLPAD